MCGILGYYHYGMRRSRQAMVGHLLGGLKRLEYRGYDSAGIAFDAKPCASLPPPANGAAANGVAANGAGEASPPVVIKSSGKIADLERQVAGALGEEAGEEEYEVHAGIAHTRWATHGQPSEVNAHPHASDPSGEFVVVHNGIITNHGALKQFLAAHGAPPFLSDTDSEVIPKLCKWLYDSMPERVPLSQLVMEALAHLEGAYAILVKSRHYPGELVGAKRGSPLILGVKSPGQPSSTRLSSPRGLGQGRDAIECFLASDASAVVEHTKRVMHLEDGDVVGLRLGGFEVFNTAERMPCGALAPSKSRALHTLSMEVGQILKGGYDHFMQKEIFEQPETLLQTMRGRVRFRPADAQEASQAAGDTQPVTGVPHRPISPPPAAAPPTDVYTEQRITLGGLTEHLDAIRDSRRLVLIGCGTSHNACLASRQTLEELVGLPVAAELASDLLDRRCPIFRDDTCVFVSQSGETADTLRALEYATSRGALCVGITNTVGSAIARGTQCGIHINAGAEIGVASTKAYTSQVVVLTMMALALSQDSISKRAQREVIADGLGHLPAAVRAALGLDSQVRALAEVLKDEGSLLVFGRGHNYATALEGALKVKEVALMHSEGLLAGEMKHGPLALIDEVLPVMVVATQDKMHAKMVSVIHQLRARRARLVLLCCEGDVEAERAAGDGVTAVLRVPRVPDCLQPVVNIVPLQLLAYHLTLLRGHDVDQPRNLAKSVTVSEEDGGGLQAELSLTLPCA